MSCISQRFWEELNIAELGDDGFGPSQLEPWLDKPLGRKIRKTPWTNGEKGAWDGGWEWIGYIYIYMSRISVVYDFRSQL